MALTGGTDKTMATAAHTATRPATGRTSHGRVIQITGAVVDIEFPAGKLPAIYNAVEVHRGDGVKIVCEVQQHLGNNWIRSVARAPSGLTAPWRPSSTVSRP